MTRKMKNPICFLLIFLTVLFSGAAVVFAQVGGSSVMIYNKAKPGTEDSSVGNEFEQALIGGLEDKYPCVDWMSDKALADAIQKLREQEAQTGELDEKALAELGNSVGATYIIIVRVFTMPNGQTTVSARVIDGKGASTVADQMAQSASDSAYGAARSVAQKILQDLAGKLRGECDAHWTGTITYSQRTDKQKDGEVVFGGQEKHRFTSVEKYDHTVEVTLQPMAKGGKMNFFVNGYESMTMSRVSRKFLDYNESKGTKTGVMNCRPHLARSYRKEYQSTYTQTIDQQGEKTETLPVVITIYKDTGKFDIKLPTPEVLIRRKDFAEEFRDDCEPRPSAPETKSSERTDPAGLVRLDGQIDPKNPDVLAGERITGTLDTRQYVYRWSLRLVQPKKKRPSGTSK